MRVIINTTFLASPRFGGSWTYTYNLLRALDAFSSEVEFIVLTNSRIVSLLRDLRMELKVVVDNPDVRASRVAWEQFVLPRLARKYKPTVFHSTGNTLPPIAGCPSVVTLHDFQYHFYPKNFSAVKRMYLRNMVPRSLRRATAIICYSEFTKRHAMDLYGVTSEKLALIYLAGLWRGEQSAATAAQTLRKKFGLDRAFVLSVSSHLPHKNLDRLIAAFGRIREEVPHDLVLAGEQFGNGSRIEELIREANGGQPSRIRVTGFVSREDLLGLYQIADAFVFPSLFEGFGIPALEAMECGCPVVASRATSLPEVIGTAGEFFDPMDTNDIARALQKVCADSKLREELRARGFERAKEFSWERMGEETMELYRRIAGN